MALFARTREVFSDPQFWVSCLWMIATLACWHVFPIEVILVPVAVWLIVNAYAFVNFQTLMMVRNPQSEEACHLRSHFQDAFFFGVLLIQVTPFLLIYFGFVIFQPLFWVYVACSFVLMVTLMAWEMRSGVSTAPSC